MKIFYGHEITLVSTFTLQFEVLPSMEVTVLTIDTPTNSGELEAGVR